MSTHCTARCWPNTTAGRTSPRNSPPGNSPRAVLSAVPNRPGHWPALLLEAALAANESGRGALIVVPDARDLARLCTLLDERIGAGNYVRLSAEDGQTPRYRSFLRVARGNTNLVVGTRNAAFAPVKDLGLAIIWDDADTSHAEPRAPYHHAREVLLLRSEIENAALLVAAPGRSAEAQRLIRSNWALELRASRALLRAHAPRVIAASDEFEQNRDPLLHAARLPAAAWREAKRALERGPVLVQVARTGFMPALRCERCRTSARCTKCTGPLALDDARGAPSCGWCGLVAAGWSCAECGFMRLRAASIGADRTVEELGRAFPNVNVVAATGAKPLHHVPDAPALIVATPGAEPVAEHGYAAVLLLDGDRMMSREGLRTGEEVLNRWMGAAQLARGHEGAPGMPGGGTVVVAGEPSEPMRALVRFDAGAYADAELGERRALGLPPAVRTALVRGPAATADKFVGGTGLRGRCPPARTGAGGRGRAPLAALLLLRPGACRHQEAADAAGKLQRGEGTDPGDPGGPGRHPLAGILQDGRRRAPCRMRGTGLGTYGCAEPRNPLTSAPASGAFS